MKKLFGLLLVVTMAMLPAKALADDGATQDDFLMRVRADVHIASGERVGSLLVINGNAVIDGVVAKSVVIIKGDVTVSGTIEGDLTVISGNATLLDTARVSNISSIHGELIRAQGAVVTGQVHERDGFSIPVGVIGLFSILFWVAMTIAVVVAGLLFAAVGGRQLTNAASAMTNNTVNVIIGMVFVWFAIPFLASVAIATLIGIPLGIGALVFLLPGLWFLGFIVAGARLGKSLIGLTGRPDASEHPYAATALGLALLQVLVLVPVLGAIVAILAGIWGAGALACIAYGAFRGKGIDSTPAGQVFQTQQPAG